MISHLVFDFSWVLLFPADKSYRGKLNALNNQLSLSQPYNPLKHFRLNIELLTFLQPYTSKRSLSIFTAGRMHNLPEMKQLLDPVFHHYFTEAEIGHPKSSPQAFLTLAHQLGTQPNTLLFVDDSKVNVQAAASAGCTAIQYQNNQQLFTTLNKINGSFPT